MSSQLKLIYPPSVEPVSVAEVKLHTHIDHDTEDTLIAMWIKSARIAAENFQWRAYESQEWLMAFDGWPDFPLMIPRPPLDEITAFTCFDVDGVEHVVDIDDFIVDVDSCPARISLADNKTLPSVMLRKINSVKILYTAGGNDDIPATVKEAIILYCAWRNENRAGETDIPRQFYDILRPDRVYLK